MNELPKRKQIRLKNYDYSQNGYYFITICTKNRQPLFWTPVGSDIIRPNMATCHPNTSTEHPNLSEYGKIVNTAINAIPTHYPNMKIDEYVIMPDHIHLILVISNDEKILLADGSYHHGKTIMTVIGQMKRWVSKEIGFSVWQKSFYEHIIRDEKDYKTKAEYILNNPLKWKIERSEIK